MSTPGHLLRALPTLLKVSLARHVAYRAEMTIWILTATLPLVMLALWNAVVGDAGIAGYGRAEIARYFVATLIVRQITGAWIVWELSYAIRQGTLSTQLLRPFPPLVDSAVWIAAAVPFRLFILTPIVGALVVWRPDLVAAPSALQAAQLVIALVEAWLLAFLVQCVFGLVAFWLDKSDSLFEMWMAVWGLLSGYVVPLAFFPDAVQGALRLLPFRAMVGLPVELLGGFVDPAQAWVDLAVGAGWVVAVWALVALLWRRGLVRYGAFGA